MLQLFLALALSVPESPVPPQAEALYQRRVTPVVEVARSAAPAVVFIRTDGYKPVRDIFGRIFAQRSTGSGSGVVIKKDGFIITNFHVVKGAKRIVVNFDEKYDEREYAAQLVSFVEHEDLALLKIEGEREFTPIPLGTSSDLMLGEPVVAIGNPYGQTHTVTQGIVSGLHRNLRIEEAQLEFDDLIQTDAAINPGNSGGPLLNINGELIGINAAMNVQAQNIGFAIPVDRVRLLLEDRLAPTWLGFEVAPGEHMQVSNVVPGSPAALAGLKSGDCIVALGGQTVVSPEDLRLARLALTPTREVELRVESLGKARTLKLEPWDKLDGVLWEHLGLRVKDVTVNRDRLVQVTGLRPGGPAERLGLGVGDLIDTLEPKLGFRARTLRVDTRDNLAKIALQLDPGTHVELEIYRDVDGDGRFTNDDLHRGALTTE